jgi:hypothetical protein
MNGRKQIPTTWLATLLITLPVLMMASPGSAEIPSIINVQGILTNSSGVPVPDGTHYALIRICNTPDGDGILWERDFDLETNKGVFSVSLNLQSLGDAVYANPLWIEIEYGGQALTPRTPLTVAPYAKRAAVAESVVGGGGGADDDWEISGDDIYRNLGQVIVGQSPTGKREPARQAPDQESRNINDSKMIIEGIHGGLHTSINEIDNSQAGRSALFASRDRGQRADGIGWGPGQTNTAITGYNLWGDSYTFGVAGYTWFDFPHTAGVLGASVDYYGIWGALAYKDESSTLWGIYTPTDLNVGGLTRTDLLQVTGGAVAGHVLTSDASGNASWAPPGAAVSDEDWVIQGAHLTHDTFGVVALGTDTPVNFYNQVPQATLQVSGPDIPAVVLDRTNPSFSRWSVYQIDNPGTLNFSHSSTAGVPTDPVLTLEYSIPQVKIKNTAGQDMIRMQADWPMEEAGPAIYMYNPDIPNNRSLILDGHNAGGGGGSIYMFDHANSIEVELHGNYAGTGQGRIITPVLEITGGSDLSEQFDIENATGTPEPGMVVCIDPDNPGRLSLSEKAYDRRVAGVISGAGGVKTGMLMGQQSSEADGDLPVALVGRVYVWADAESGPIEPGDLLTTADRPGHAMKVGDHSRATGAILGKAMSGLDDGQGLILTLVALQ